jgi:hypothetical protein
MMQVRKKIKFNTVWRKKIAKFFKIIIYRPKSVVIVGVSFFFVYISFFFGPFLNLVLVLRMDLPPGS